MGNETTDADVQLYIKYKKDEAAKIQEEIEKVEAVVLEKQADLRKLRTLSTQAVEEYQIAERKLMVQSIPLEQWYEWTGSKHKCGYNNCYCYSLGRTPEGMLIAIVAHFQSEQECYAEMVRVDPREVVRDTRLKVLVQYGDLSSLRDQVLHHGKLYALYVHFRKINGKWQPIGDGD